MQELSPLGVGEVGLSAEDAETQLGARVRGAQRELFHHGGLQLSVGLFMGNGYCSHYSLMSITK